MQVRKILRPFAALLIVSLGCDDPPEQAALPSLPGAMDASPALRTGPVYGVVSSDYTATSLSLLDARGEVMADDYLNSGSARAGLVTALSGDVTLPNASGEPGVLVVLDRYKTDVITRVRLADATILGQVKTHTPPAQASMNAYSSNPHDYVAFGPDSAWVTRFEPNLDPAVPEIDRGTDLLRIDPSTMTRTADRIDLSVLNTKGTRMNLATMQPEEVDVFARPSRMVRIGDLLIVGLSRMSFDFTAYGPGMIAIVNVQTRSVAGFELPGLASCTRVEEVPGAPDLVLVGCSGFRRAPADPRATGGIALVRIVDGAPRLEHLYRASDHPSDQAAFSHVFSLGGTLVAAVAYGAREMPAMGGDTAVAETTDRLLILDLATGVIVRELFRAEAAFSISAGLYDPASGLILVPDATVDANRRPTAGVRRFRFTAPDTFEELPTVKVAERLNMPVRSIEYLGSP